MLLAILKQHARFRALKVSKKIICQDESLSRAVVGLSGAMSREDFWSAMLPDKKNLVVITRVPLSVFDLAVPSYLKVQ
jgi:hypothetical protein